ncbi:MAG: hypothetical protein ABFS46_20730 [Myxococcota bacterium]
MSRARLARRPAALAAEPDLTKAQKAAIVRALRWGWQQVSRRWPQTVASGWEEEITTKLCDVLCEQDSAGRRLAPGLSQFETVNRGAKTQGANDRVEYQPDLTFRPIAAPGVRSRNRWGWFVECKIVDGGSSVRLYCQKGVQRFIDGLYAPRMPSAALLAYVRDDRSPYTSLKPMLENDYQSKVVASSVVPEISIISRHDRTKLRPPCALIELTHVWLPTPSADSTRGHQAHTRS